MTSADRTLESRLLPTIEQRARPGAIFLLTASVLLAVSDGLRGGDNVVAVVALQMLRVLVFAGVVVFFARPRGERIATRVVLGALGVLAASAGVIGALRGDLAPQAVVAMGTLFGCAALIPWGARPQLLAGLMFTLALAVNCAALHDVGKIPGAANALFAYLAAMIGSVYLAALDARRRRAAVEALAEVTRAESRLRDLNDALEHRVAERTADLARANRELEISNRDMAGAHRELEEAYRELEGFTHAVSHDLRVPLRVINGLSQLAMEECGGAIDEAGRDYLARIGQESIRVGEVADDLLALARVTRAPMAPCRVDASALMRELIAERRVAEPERKVEMSVFDDIWLYGDRRLLRIALGHLLGNAWKFTRQRDPGRIEVGHVSVDGQRGLFVRDDGVGFAPEVGERLFGRFERPHGLSESQHSGIGLAIVHRIVRRHGGRVWAQGEPGRGATFLFCLPWLTSR